MSIRFFSKILLNRNGDNMAGVMVPGVNPKCFSVKADKVFALPAVTYTIRLSIAAAGNLNVFGEGAP